MTARRAPVYSSTLEDYDATTTQSQTMDSTLCTKRGEQSAEPWNITKQGQEFCWLIVVIAECPETIEHRGRSGAIYKYVDRDKA